MSRTRPLSLSRSLLIGLANLILGLSFLALYWHAWREDINLHTLWLLVAALSCLGLGFLYLVFPFVSRPLSPKRRGSVLALRLSPLSVEIAGPSFPLIGMAFGVLAIPLWIVVIISTTGSLEQFVVLGLGIIASVLAVSLLAIGLRQGYTRLCAQPEIEIDNDLLMPGLSTALYITNRRGRLPVQGITISLICRRQDTLRQGRSSRVHTKILHEALLYTVPEHDCKAGGWQTQLNLAIPPNAQATIDGKNYPKILWDIQARVRLSRLPDYREYFPITVLPLEDEESEEA